MTSLIAIHPGHGSPENPERPKLRLCATKSSPPISGAGRSAKPPCPRATPIAPAAPRRDFVYLNGRRAPVSLCGRNAVQIHERRRPLDLAELAARLDGLGRRARQRIRAPLHQREHEITVFPDGRAIVKGTTDIGVARGIYSRYIGN